MARSAEIANKQKRNEIYAREKAAKSADRIKKRQRQKDLAREGGEIGDARPIKVQKTLDNTREKEPTFVERGDAEIDADERDDEFSVHDTLVRGIEAQRPKIMISTRPRPSRELFRFIGDLLSLMPNAFFYPRRHFSVAQICGFASNKDFTHVIIISEKAKVANGMLVAHLPVGPTAFFKLSNVEVSASVDHAGRKTDHEPEVLLNNFSTRLGRRVGRFLGSLFFPQPEFQGRQAVTFHNQRDYIFVRHHRYIFEEKDDKLALKEQEKKISKKPTKKVIARLQELGPRFTLKMRWLQDGVFDTQHGEYEWFHRRKEMDTSRRKFHL